MHLPTPALPGAAALLLSPSAQAVANQVFGARVPAFPGQARAPSASVGLSAVAGTASTFMRSDAAPALSVSISPTWTGNHTFSPSSGDTTIGAGALKVNGTSGTLVRIGTDSGNGSTGFFPLTVGDGNSGGGGTNQNFVRIGRMSDGTAAIDSFQGGVGAAALAFTRFGTENARFDASGNFKLSAQVGFNGTTPIAKPTVTGSRGGNAALASLLTALANYGLITDSTTA